MMRGTRFWALVAVAVATLGLVPAGPGAQAAPAPAGIRWSPCHRIFGPYQCATVQVPLDHDVPNGATISLAIVRLPASGPGPRIGSVFVNPGGPGGSGVDVVVEAGPFLFPPEVSQRFDIVGFDPRGVGRSTPLRCFGNARQLFAGATPFPFPVTDEEEALVIESDRRFVAACDRRDSRLAEHMSTANVARDLDLLRAAVGDAQLTYFGLSYGSLLGTTYANLFPGRVRAVAIDSVLDPIAWANEGGTIPFSTRLRSDASALATLGEFHRLCDAGGQRCAFGPGSATRFEALAQRLRTAPVMLTDPAGGPFAYGYTHLIGDTLSVLYAPPVWADFAGFLAALEAEASAQTVAAARGAFQVRLAYDTKRGFPRYPNFVESLAGVACSDADDPFGYPAWSAAADAAEADFGHFGRPWTWASSVCAEWPFEDTDRYPGPFDRATANPVLVVNNLFDPATAYQSAVKVDGLLPNSALLTVTGWGHGVIGTSACADQVVARYLVERAVPAAGATCAPDAVPFAAP